MFVVIFVFEKTGERPGSLPSPSGSAIAIHLAFYKNLRSGLGTEKFSASRDFDTYSLKRNRIQLANLGPIWARSVSPYQAPDPCYSHDKTVEFKLKLKGSNTRKRDCSYMCSLFHFYVTAYV